MTTEKSIAETTADVRQLTEEIRQDREATAETWRGIAARIRMLAAMDAGNWPPRDEEEDR